MIRYASADDAARAWRDLPYQHFGFCSRCQFDRDETGRALVVRRGTRGLGSAWLCRSCYSRLHIRRVRETKAS